MTTPSGPLVIRGDARALPLPDCSVDAVVCDPPYELSFMGRSWDSTGVAFDTGPWREALRVLKPGGHLAAFGATRTYHRLGCAIEDAGFEIRDSIRAGVYAWVYGCLTADAEVLTERGWRAGLDVEQGERVAQWDSVTGAITLAAVQQTYRAPWDGPMRVLRNADTDQVLTQNHRVYHRPRQREQVGGTRRSWYGEAWEVTEANDVSTWNPTQLPVAGEHDGPGIGGVDYAALLGWVWTEGGFDHSGTGVRIYQSSVNAEKVAEIDSLLDRLGPHKRYDRERTYRDRTYVETTWFFTGELAGRVRADLPGKRPTYRLLWRMTGAEKRSLRDAALLGDGSCSHRKGASPTWQFYQRYEDDLVWFATLLALVGQAGKVTMRPDRPNGSVAVRDRSTTELQARHLQDDVEHYVGEVWCVRVPTGAFVARRHGRVFITGNSGFPKSLDVGKAIDKAGGGSPVEHGRVLRQARERSGLSRQDVVGAVGCTLTSLRDWEEGRSRAVGESPEVCTPSPVYRAKLADLLGYTADERQVAGVGRKAGPLHEYGHGELLYGPAATDAARTWDGWGTALKPAWEPIVVARKPLDGTVAASVLAHGTGAINIDACRVGMSDADRAIVDKRSGGEDQQRDAVWQNGAGGRPPGERFTSAAGGRFPSNLLIAHHPDCGDGCHELCHVRAVDEQSGTLTSGTTKASHADSDGGRSGGIMGAHTARQRTRDWAGDSGGASRYYPTFRYEPKAPTWQRPQVDGRGFETVKPLDLMRWLVRLLTPPGGLVLDMFPGTGTTGQAAQLEGFRSLLVELEADHIPFIRERLAQQVVVDRKTNEAVPVTPPPDDALSLFDLEAS